MKYLLGLSILINVGLAIGMYALDHTLKESRVSALTCMVDLDKSDAKAREYRLDSTICVSTHQEYTLHGAMINLAFERDIIIASYHGFDALDRCENMVKNNPKDRFYCLKNP
jgi:hypothetical protein